LHAQELIKPLLFAGEARAAALDAYIVERISAAIAVLKACRTKEQTTEYLMALALVMPPKEAKRLDAISKRVGFSYGQSSKRGGRKRAADHQMERRADFDKVAASLEQPLQVGEEVLAGRGSTRARGELALLEAADGNGRCAVMFRAGSEEVRVEYKHSFGKIDKKVPVGSAQLQRPPPTLLPLPRETRSDKMSAEKCEHVREVITAPPPHAAAPPRCPCHARATPHRTPHAAGVRGGLRHEPAPARFDEAPPRAASCAVGPG